MVKEKAAEPEVVSAEPALRHVLAQAPTVQEVLAHPERYEAWLKKAQEALANG